MCEAQNAANPDGFASILTKLQQKILVSKSDSGLNALAIVAPTKTERKDLVCAASAVV